MAVKHAIDENKTQVIQKKITKSNGDQKKLFNIGNTLLGRRKQLVLPDYNNPITLASTSFLSKLIEKVISSRILTHIADNDLIDKFQSAFRCGYSTETALLRVYSDIVTMVGKGHILFY